jgi:hypothetical protein
MAERGKKYIDWQNKNHSKVQVIIHPDAIVTLLIQY